MAAPANRPTGQDMTGNTAPAIALARSLDRELGRELCQRAAAFLGEWSEDGSAVVRVLMRALEIDATADWAFRRLTMTLTMERRWEELLTQYDRVIAATEAPARRIELYTEAAQVAKDLAGRADRAIVYLDAGKAEAGGGRGVRRRRSAKKKNRLKHNKEGEVKNFFFFFFFFFFLGFLVCFCLFLVGCLSFL